MHQTWAGIWRHDCIVGLEQCGRYVGSTLSTTFPLFLAGRRASRVPGHRVQGSMQIFHQDAIPTIPVGALEV